MKLQVSPSSLFWQITLQKTKSFSANLHDKYFQWK